MFYEMGVISWLMFQTLDKVIFLIIASQGRHIPLTSFSITNFGHLTEKSILNYTN